MSRNKHKRNFLACCCCLFTFSWVVAPIGAVCFSECLSASLALREFFQAINFHFSRTTEHQPTRNPPISPHSCLQFFPPRAIKDDKICEYSHSKWPTVSLFLTTFTANLSIALSSSCSAWSISPTEGFQASLQTWYPRTSESNVNFSMFELTTRLLPTFKVTSHLRGSLSGPSEKNSYAR